MKYPLHKLPLALLGCFLLQSPAYAAPEYDDHRSVVSVVGQAQVKLAHDTASLRGAVITEHLKAQEAVKQNAVIVQKIRNALKKSGLQADNVLTQNYQLTTNYSYDNGIQKFKNYSVTHELKVSTHNLDQIGQIADVFTQAGGNQIHAIEFSADNNKKAHETALKNAVIDAKNKAMLVTQHAGMKLGVLKTITVQQMQNYNPQPVVLDSAVKMAAEARTEPTHFQTDGQIITVTVDTHWNMLP